MQNICITCIILFIRFFLSPLYLNYDTHFFALFQKHSKLNKITLKQFVVVHFTYLQLKIMLFHWLILMERIKKFIFQ